MSQSKFLKILNPEQTSHLSIHIEFTRADEILHIKARGEYGSDIFFKLDGMYHLI